MAHNTTESVYTVGGNENSIKYSGPDDHHSGGLDSSLLARSGRSYILHSPADEDMSASSVVPMPLPQVVKLTVEKILPVQIPVPVVQVEERLVEVPVVKIIEKIVHVERLVYKIVEVPIERIVERVVERVVTVEVPRPVPVPMERLKIVEVPVEVITEKMVPQVIEKIVEVPVDRVIYKTVEKVVPVPVPVPVRVPVRVPVAVPNSDVPHPYVTTTDWQSSLMDAAGMSAAPHVYTTPGAGPQPDSRPAFSTGGRVSDAIPAPPPSHTPIPTPVHPPVSSLSRGLRSRPAVATSSAAGDDSSDDSDSPPRRVIPSA